MRGFIVLLTLLSFVQNLAAQGNVETDCYLIREHQVLGGAVAVGKDCTLIPIGPPLVDYTRAATQGLSVLRETWIDSAGQEYHSGVFVVAEEPVQVLEKTLAKYTESLLALGLTFGGPSIQWGPGGSDPEAPGTSTQSVQTTVQIQVDTDGDGTQDQTRYRTLITYRRAGETTEHFMDRHQELETYHYDRGWLPYGGN